MNNITLSEQVDKTIKKHELIVAGDTVVTGISGGPDSVCLVHVLHSLAPRYDLTLVGVHINHLLRGNEADEDERYVSELCRQLGIRLFTASYDIRSEAKRKGMSLEEAGREIRYAHFARVAEETGANRIAVAHNKNDQAETVILNILRGTGLDGLKGMDYIRGNVIRPLLDVPRAVIEDYCRQNSLSPRIDSSNLEKLYTRNRVRLGLIPYIQEEFGGNIVDSIARMTNVLRDENNYIEKCANISYNQLANIISGNRLELDLAGLGELDTALLKRVLRLAVMDIGSSLKGIESKHIESLADLVHKGQTGMTVQLPRGIRVLRTYGRIVFTMGEQTRETKEYDERILIPGKTYIETTGACLTSQIIKIEGNAKDTAHIRQNLMMQLFDYDLLKEGINIRNRRDGDVFKPFKSSGTKKLKEFFIDKKIPREIRDDIPVIAKGKEIVWVVGHKISDKFKVTENTKSVLKLVYSINI